MARPAAADQRNTQIGADDWQQRGQPNRSRHAAARRLAARRARTPPARTVRPAGRGLIGRVIQDRLKERHDVTPRVHGTR
ncbi:hypothetical protein [Frankia sp. Cppng1_Ct_nod]|uniref:hypothetical protein n=1 Tax=Frankia sp. Cppng1_Ct_nod TaxID=2897162 RepID=UPI0010416D08|nr:hypothetical protein [Frankia sp. Cppng1_Ct_nod]